MGSAASSLVGRKLGRYDVLEHLATGRLAEVLIARREVPGAAARRVALKRILPRFAKDPAVREAVAAGVVATSALAGRGAVHVEDVVEEEGELLVELELLEGVTVARAIERAGELGVAFELADVVHIATVLAETLARVHAAKDADGVPLLHGGIAPSSIFLTRDGEVKLLEFGVERALAVLDPDTRSGLIGQRAHYLSPEQIGFRNVSGRADVWALGVTLWELATGEALFAASTLLETIDLVRAAKVPVLSKVRDGWPEAFDRLLRDMMRAEPDARPTMAQVLTRLRSELSTSESAGAGKPATLLDRLGLIETASIGHDATVPIGAAISGSHPLDVLARSAPANPEGATVEPDVESADTDPVPHTADRAIDPGASVRRPARPAELSRRPTPSAGAPTPRPIRAPTPSAGLPVGQEAGARRAAGSATFVVGSPRRAPSRATLIARDAIAIALGGLLGWLIVEIVLRLLRR